MAKFTKWITYEGLIRIEGWARDGLSDKEIALEKIGVAESTFSDWKKKFPELSESLKKGKEVVDREVENALLKRAKGFTYTEVTQELIPDTGQKKRHDGVQDLTEEQWTVSQAYFERQCAYCGKAAELTKDHLDPLKNGGKLTFSNVVPACQSCNSSKKDHQWLSWYQKQTFYDKERAKRIADFISFALLLPGNEKKPTEKLVVTKTVTKQVAPDTGAIALWLKNRKPDVWRDKPENKEKVEKLLDAQIEKAEAEAKILTNKADKLTAGGQTNDLLQALLDVKSGGNGDGSSIIQSETD